MSLPIIMRLSTAGKRVGDEDPLQGLWNAEGEQQLQQLFASVATLLSGELRAASNATKEVAKSEFK